MTEQNPEQLSPAAREEAEYAADAAQTPDADLTPELGEIGKLPTADEADEENAARTEDEASASEDGADEGARRVRRGDARHDLDGHVDVAGVGLPRRLAQQPRLGHRLEQEPDTIHLDQIGRTDPRIPWTTSESNFRRRTLG